jgi:hypothetical protein
MWLLFFCPVKTISTYFGRRGSTRALVKIIPSNCLLPRAFRRRIEKSLLPLFEFFAVCRLTAAVNAVHMARKISSVEVDDLPSDLICLVATSNDKK